MAPKCPPYLQSECVKDGRLPLGPTRSTHITRASRTLCALLLVVCMVAAASVSAAGCIQFGVKPLPYRVLASAAPGGVSPGFEETLLPLLTKAGAYVLTGEGEWQRLRDSLNLGTDAQLYGAIDFSRQVLLVFFHGLGASMGDRIIIRSLRAAGRRVTATLGLERGLLTAIGFPYTIIAVDRADLAGRGAEPAEWTFDVRSGRTQIAALRATVSPPAAGEPLVGWPSPRVLGSGVPQDWAPDAQTILVAREGAGGAGQPAAQGLFALDYGAPQGATAIPVYTPEQGSPGPARFSPDGSLVATMNAVDGRLRLIIAAARSGGSGEVAGLPRDLTPGGYDLTAALSWSPDGRSIAVTGRETGGARQHVLLSIPVTLTGAPVAPHRLFAQSGGLASPTWGAPGEVYFLRQTSQGSVLAVRAAAGGPVSDLVPAVRYALSPDAQWLAYIAETAPGETSLRVVPMPAMTAPGSTAPAGSEVARGQTGSPAWSPDGRMLAYTVRPPPQQQQPLPALSAGDLWLVKVDSGRPQQMTAGATVSEVRFSPDGRWISLALHPGGVLAGRPRSLVAVITLGE